MMMIRFCPIHFHIHPAFSEAMRQDKIWQVEGKSAPPRILCGTGVSCHQKTGNGLRASMKAGHTPIT